MASGARGSPPSTGYQGWRDSILLMVQKAGFVGLFLAINVLLARILGPEGFGTFVFALSLTGILATFGAFGQEKLATRHIPSYLSHAHPARVRALVGHIHGVTLLAACALGLCVAVALSAFGWAGLGGSAAAVGLLVIGDALLRVQRGVLQGFSSVVTAGVPEFVLRPGLVLVTVGGLALGGIVGSDVNRVLWLYVGVTAAVLLISSRLTYRQVRVLGPGQGQGRPWPWLRECLPLVAAEGVVILNGQADLVMVGGMLDAHAAGIYGVANRGALIIAFLVGAINTAMAPRVARLYAIGDVEALRALLSGFARGALLTAVMGMLGYALFGEGIIRMFGEGFAGARVSLLLLSGGQVLSAAMGAVGIVLMMTGSGGAVAGWMAIAAAVNILANAWLIPRLGIDGAALGTVVSMVVWNVGLGREVRRRIRVDPSVMGRRLV